MARELTPKQRRFIAAFQTGIPAAQAAVQAGYSPKTAKHAAYQLMHDNKLVRAELDKLRQHLIAEAEYNGEKALADCDNGMAFAIKTANANAYVRAAELKMRLTGLLRDKLDITVDHVDIGGALAEARARALRLPCDLAPAIEGEFEAVPSSAPPGATNNESTDRAFPRRGPDPNA